MKENLLMNVLIVDNEKSFSSLIKNYLSSSLRIHKVFLTENLEEAKKILAENDHIGIMIDIYNLNLEKSLDFINIIRNLYPNLPFCIIGTVENLLKLPGVEKKWKDRLEHYYKLFKDQPANTLNEQIENTIYKFESYLVSRLAKVKLSDLRNMISSNKKNTIIVSDVFKNQIEETLDVTEKALERKPQFNNNVIPGFENDDVQELIKETIAKTNRILDRTANVNISILVVGLLITIASFIVAIINNSWEAVTFGGFGISGIISSLIMNPLHTISNGSTKVVQLQVAYLSFLNQVQILKNDSSNTGENNSLRRCEMLKNSTYELLKILNV